MSTVPSTPKPVPNIIQVGELGRLSAYLKAHERLIVVVLLLLAGIFAYGKGLGFLTARDQRQYDSKAQVLQAQASADAALARQNAAAAQQYQQLAAQLAASNAALAQSQAQRNATVVVQQKTDAALPPADLALRWQQLLNLPTGSVQPVPGGFAATPSAAVDTVVALENVPVLEADLKDEQAVVANQDAQVKALIGLNAGLQQQVAGLGKDLADQRAADAAALKLAKAEARRSKFHWFGIGYVVGFASAEALRLVK